MHRDYWCFVAYVFVTADVCYFSSEDSLCCESSVSLIVREIVWTACPMRCRPSWLILPSWLLCKIFLAAFVDSAFRSFVGRPFVAAFVDSAFVDSAFVAAL